MPKVSLNHVWDDFAANGKGLLDYELTTPVTITFAEGRSVTATLALTRAGGPSDGMVDIELDMDSLQDMDDSDGAREDYGREERSLLDVNPTWADGWVKQAIVDTFGIDPDSPIWEFD
jgi:hypothetical protein